MSNQGSAGQGTGTADAVARPQYRLNRPEMQSGPPAAEGATLEKIIGWDVVTWSRALPLFEQALGSDMRGKKSLEIGASNGGLSLWLALKGSEVTCSFYSRDAHQAMELHDAFGVRKHVHYEHLDATRMPYRNCFDVIVLKSVIGGIGAGNRPDRQRQAIESIRTALKDGGLFLFAENVVATPVHTALRTIKRSDRWRYLQVDELRSMLGRFSNLEYFTTGFFACFGRSEAQRRVLGQIDSVVCPMVPQHWRYVMIGVAAK